MQVLFAVLDDLFRFALRSLFGFVALSDRRAVIEQLPAPLQPLLPLLPTVEKPVRVELASPHGSYFVSSKCTAVRLDPVAAFDNVIAELTYGTQISVLKYGGRWAMVEVRGVTGWILKDHISSAAADVFPNFTTGMAYEAEAETTKKVRLLIDDMFACTEPGLPLTGPEYVTYRLWRDRREVNWSTDRPRLPGQWQTFLRGRTGIHIGVIPKTGAVMEWIVDDAGVLAYVEAVFPDGSIQLSAVDHEGLGVYSESVLQKDVWRELRPVFIEVT